VDPVEEVLLKATDEIGEVLDVSVSVLKALSQELGDLLSLDVNSVLELLLSTDNRAEKSVLDDKLIILADGDGSDG